MRSTGAFIFFVGALGGLTLAGALHGAAQAQGTGQYGARVGNAYLPSSHDAGCQGLLCSSVPLDPARPSQPLVAPPCEGLICGVTPYSMQRPYTAGEAAEAERARAAAQAQAAQQGEPAAPAPIRHRRKAHKAKVAAAPRTPAPAEPEAAK